MKKHNAWSQGNYNQIEEPFDIFVVSCIMYVIISLILGIIIWLAMV